MGGHRMLKVHGVGSGVSEASPPNSWLSDSVSHVGIWKSTVVGIFTLQQLANAKNQDFLP